MTENLFIPLQFVTMLKLNTILSAMLNIMYGEIPHMYLNTALWWQTTPNLWGQLVCFICTEVSQLLEKLAFVTIIIEYVPVDKLSVAPYIWYWTRLCNRSGSSWTYSAMRSIIELHLRTKVPYSYSSIHGRIITPHRKLWVWHLSMYLSQLIHVTRIGPCTTRLTTYNGRHRKLVIFPSNASMFS